MKPKNLCIIQARSGSTRLPDKVLLRVNGVSLLEYEVKRVKQAEKADKIVIATSDAARDDKIEKLCRKIKVDCFRGSENDVLDRYYQCSLRYNKYNNIIRITGDCPLIDAKVIDHVIALFKSNNYDYVSNVRPPTFPDGMDVEVFTKDALSESAKKAKLASEREHVTLYISKNKKLKKGNLSAQYDWSHFRLTVDEKADFEVVKFLIKNSKITAGYLDYISLLTKHPRVMFKNMRIARNEGLLKSLKDDYKVKI